MNGNGILYTKAVRRTGEGYTRILRGCFEHNQFNGYGQELMWSGSEFVSSYICIGNFEGGLAQGVATLKVQFGYIYHGHHLQGKLTGANLRITPDNSYVG